MKEQRYGVILWQTDTWCLSRAAFSMYVRCHVSVLTMTADISIKLGMSIRYFIFVYIFGMNRFKPAFDFDPTNDNNLFGIRTVGPIRKPKLFEPCHHTSKTIIVSPRTLVHATMCTLWSGLIKPEDHPSIPPSRTSSVCVFLYITNLHTHIQTYTHVHSYRHIQTHTHTDTISQHVDDLWSVMSNHVGLIMHVRLCTVGAQSLTLRHTTI